MPRKSSLFMRSLVAKRSRKQKMKEVLNADMISMPLGDFRHLSHIGRDEDPFGDLSFLQGSHKLLKSAQSEHNLLIACNPPPKPPRIHNDRPQSPHSGQQTELSFSTKKYSVSMSMLDNLDSEESWQEGIEDQEESRGLALTDRATKQDPSLEKDTKNKSPHNSEPDLYPYPAFLDLGPSILDDVLQVMNKHECKYLLPSDCGGNLK
ncbi:cdc42 effector protein 3-like [Polyodon spathula]|uniref:cdc42 effector protein 3-like n=1 Tax=Polyodon spathula TaxID=7913 RepID=UPI001B7DE16B|nr:cdc42 effector protein 3-like [Polyodon spathula]XP_041132013.1 cdc42 effector protein 3-like [Polyodon spathula]